MATHPRLVVPEADRPRQQRRTAQIVEAVRSALESRRNTIDGDDDIRAVTISIKMKNGTDQPRAVVVNIESEKTLSNS